MELVKNYLRQIFSAFVAVVVSTGTASAAVVVNADDNLSAHYVRNSDFQTTRPVWQLLRGQTVTEGSSYIPDGTRFVVTNYAPINAAKLKKGDKVTFVLPEDFIVNDVVIAKEGTELIGTVTRSQGKSITDGHRYLAIEIKEFITGGGEYVALKCVVKDRARHTIYFPAKSEFIASVVGDTDLHLPHDNGTKAKYSLGAMNNI